MDERQRERDERIRYFIVEGGGDAIGAFIALIIFLSLVAML